MSFTTLGTPNWGTSPTIGTKLEYERTRDGTAMKYRFKVTINALPTSGAGYFGYPIYLSITLNSSSVLSGHTLKTSSPSRWNSAITYTSSWYTVSNKTSGTVPVAIKIYSGSGCTRTGTYSYSLTVDPCVSSLTASNGTLGTAQNLGITAYATYTHKITYTCGTASGTIYNQSSGSTTVSWTPPISLASEYPAATSVAVTLKLATYSGSTKLGEVTKTITCAVPASVKPTVTINKADPQGYYSTYSKWIQGYSKLKVTLSITLGQGSAISAYSIKIGNQTFTTSSATVDLPTAGSVSISVTVTDKRGRKGTATSSITVTAYNKPQVTAFSAGRCDSAGNPDATGDYIKAIFSAKITNISGNTATYYFYYRKKGDPDWTRIDLTALDDTFTVNNYTVGPIAADGNYAYEVTMRIGDAINGFYRYLDVTIPKAFVLMQATADGTGLAIGGKATDSDTLAIMLKTFLPSGGAIDVISNIASLNNRPSGAQSSGIALKLMSGTNAYYILIDSNAAMWTGKALSGATTITWVAH